MWIERNWVPFNLSWPVCVSSKLEVCQLIWFLQGTGREHQRQRRLRREWPQELGQRGPGGVDGPDTITGVGWSLLQAGFVPEQGEASPQLIRNGERGFLDLAQVSLQRKVSPAGMGISLTCAAEAGKAGGELLCVKGNGEKGKWRKSPDEGNQHQPAALAGWADAHPSPASPQPSAGAATSIKCSLSAFQSLVPLWMSCKSPCTHKLERATCPMGSAPNKLGTNAVPGSHPSTWVDARSPLPSVPSNPSAVPHHRQTDCSQEGFIDVNFLTY